MEQKNQFKNGYTFNRIINGCWQLSSEHCLQGHLDVRDALRAGRLGGFAMDVYEREGETQRRDLRGKELPDPLLRELLAMDNVVFTSHTAFYTDEAIGSIVETTLRNLHDLSETGACSNRSPAGKGGAR